MAGLLLSGCNQAGQEGADSKSGDLIACALDGDREFESKCAVERALVDDELQLVVRHPDGGFRKFVVLTDGRGLTTADGSEEIESRLVDDERIEIKVGSDSYRFPVTVKSETRDEPNS